MNYKFIKKIPDPPEPEPPEDEPAIEGDPTEDAPAPPLPQDTPEETSQKRNI